MAATRDPYEDEDPYRQDVLAALRTQVGASPTLGEAPPYEASPYQVPGPNLSALPAPDEEMPETGNDPPPPAPPILPPDEPPPNQPPDWEPPNDFPDPIPGYVPGVPPPSETPPPGPPPPGGSVGPQPPGSAPTGGPVDPFRARLTAALMKALETDPYAVSADDPSIRPAIEAYYRTRERALGAERTAAAERANASGGGGGALDAARERAFQSFGQDVGNYSGQAVLHELTSRKSYLENMSKVSLGLLTADQDAALRMQIAQINAEIDRVKLAQQNTQFGQELDYKYAELQA